MRCIFMKIFEFNNLLNDEEVLQRRLKEYEEKNLFKKQNPERSEIQGHLAKADHNLRFIQDNLKLGYFDWCITGCYYAVYHCALSLLLHKGYSTKMHDATLCLLIKEYYTKGVTKEDLELINNFFLEYQD